MFIAILTYIKPLEEVDSFLQAHRDYLSEHYSAGDFIASGPQNPRVGGVIMIKASDLGYGATRRGLPGYWAPAPTHATTTERR